DLGTSEGGLHLFGRRGAHDNRSALLVCVAQCVVVGRVQHERVVEIELALERDLRHPPPGGSEPALPHSSTVSPGWICSTCALVSFASSSGRPTRIGNVPQCPGTQRGLPSSSRARAASFGPIV